MSGLRDEAATCSRLGSAHHDRLMRLGTGLSAAVPQNLIRSRYEVYEGYYPCSKIWQ